MFDFLKDTNKRKLFIFNYCVFMINGLLTLSVGSLLPFIRSARGIGYGFAGLIVSLHSVGNLVACFIAGALPAVIGKKKSILFFNLFFALSYLFIIFGKNPFWLAAAFFLTGIARGASSNFCNTEINSLAPGKAWIINGLHAMFSVGAFAFPIFLTILTADNADNWIIACYVMVGIGILSWILYLLMPIENDKVEKTEKGKGGLGFFAEPIFYLCTGTLFFYLCVEQGVIGWLITYFEDTGLLSASLSQLMASVLWIMILAGRLLTATLSTKIKKENLLVIMGLGIVFFYFLLINSTTTFWIVAGIMGFGFSMAGIYPTTVSFSGGIIEKFPMAWSYILTIASLGSIIMPSIIGKIADKKGIGPGMASVAVVVLIDLVSIIGLVIYCKKKGEKVSL